MPVLLQINQICKAHGARIILDNATATFSSDQKIGMIGRNGAGKSTLCRILTGHEKADSGTISANSVLRLSYLEQHDTFKAGESVLDFLMRTTGAEGWQCGATAVRFQIKNDMLNLPFQSLPGGYQTRVKLTAMLLREPNFLILDEPSNYLDLSTLILLENFLLDFRGGYLIVSHDREFLKRTCDHTLEIQAGKLTLYPGDIEEYFEFKEVQTAQKLAHNRGVQKKRDQLQEFIDRFRAKASTASRAQSKIKQLAKLKTIEIAHQTRGVRIHMPPVERKTGRALSCEDLAIGYPEKEVASGIRFDIERGERVAVLGDNGEGKTTFLRTLAGDLPPKGGTFRWAAGLKTAYYAQHVSSALHSEDTVYSHLMRESSEGVTQQEILTMAGCFLFKGDDTKKKVAVLSGGECSRLVLAGLLLSKSQVLLLDEPTNHLDFETVEALGHSLRSFSGTVFFISHDRTFVNLIATHILEVNHGKVRRCPGTYEDYVYHLESVARDERPKENSHSRLGPRPWPGDRSRSTRPGPGTPGEWRRNEVEPSLDAAARRSEKSQTPPALNSQRYQSLREAQGQVKEKAALKSEMTKIKKLRNEAERRLNHFAEERGKLLEEIRKNPFFHSRDRTRRLKELQIHIEKAKAERRSLQ